MMTFSCARAAALLTSGLLTSLLFLLAGAGSVEGAVLESRDAPFDGTTVHYKISGKGSEALIFVHGWSCNSDFWRGQTGEFPDVRVIAVDLPGHGQSGKPQTEYTMSFFARSIDAVMRHAGVKRAVLVGHSMGTPVIRQFCRLYPEKTLALVIVDGALRLLTPAGQIEALTARLREDYKTAAPQMVDGMLSPIKDEKMKAEIREAMLSTPSYVTISALTSMFDPKVYETDPIKVPVLAILAKSPFWQADTETFLHYLALDLEFHMWEGVSHFLMMERPQEFNRTLRNFLVGQSLLKARAVPNGRSH
jgi:pimeloyl-ACP methyl ester carboxylesterase